MKIFLPFFIFLFSCSISSGQIDFDRFFVTSSDFRIGIPMNEFNKNIDGAAVGLGGYTMFGPWEAPLFLGVEGSWLTYAHEELPDGPFDLKTNSRIITGHAVVQYVFAISPTVQPYINGMLGFKNLYTNTRTIDEGASDSKVVNKEKHLNDTAFSYGGAFGFYIGIDEYFPFRIDLRLAYLWGTRASYLNRNDSIDIQTVDNPIDVFEEKLGRTNLLIPQIGLVLVL